MKYSYVYTSKIRQAFFADTLELAIFGMGLEYHIKNLTNIYILLYGFLLRMIFWLGISNVLV